MDGRMDSIRDRCSIVYYIFDRIPDSFFIYSILTYASRGEKQQQQQKKEKIRMVARAFSVANNMHKRLKHYSFSLSI